MCKAEQDTTSASSESMHKDLINELCSVVAGVQMLAQRNSGASTSASGENSISPREQEEGRS